MNKEKIQLEQLVKGGEETLFNAVLVSLCAITGIVSLLVFLLTK